MPFKTATNRISAAGRLVKIEDESNNVLETYTYGASRERLITETSTQRTYYAWGGGSGPLVEYTEATASSTPVYAKAYVYAGSRLLSTATNLSGTELVEFHHPDRMGTRLVTDPASVSHYQQSTLPFGTAMPAESGGFSNQVFTSYDRSASTGLDYAVNRTYSTGQSRFTQVDPIGMAAASTDPQSNNLYAYVQNSPIDFVDPSGLLRRVCWNINIGDGQTYEWCVDFPTFDPPVDRPPRGPGSGPPDPPAPEPANENEQLKKCYKLALDGYNAAGQTEAQQRADALKFTGFVTSITGAITSGIGQAVANQSRVSVTLRGNRVVVRNRVAGLAARAAGIGVVAGGLVVDGLEYAGAGRLGALRNGIKECNDAHKNATNKIGLYSPFLAAKVSDVINN